MNIITHFLQNKNYTGALILSLLMAVSTLWISIVNSDRKYELIRDKCELDKALLVRHYDSLRVVDRAEFIAANEKLLSSKDQTISELKSNVEILSENQKNILSQFNLIKRNVNTVKRR